MFWKKKPVLPPPDPLLDVLCEALKRTDEWKADEYGIEHVSSGLHLWTANGMWSLDCRSFGAKPTPKIKMTENRRNRLWPLCAELRTALNAAPPLPVEADLIVALLPKKQGELK